VVTLNVIGDTVVEPMKGIHGTLIGAAGKTVFPRITTATASGLIQNYDSITLAHRTTPNASGREHRPTPYHLHRDRTGGAIRLSPRP